MKMEGQFKKKFDMDYDGMGNQGRFPITEKNKKIKTMREKLSYIAVIIFWFVIVMVLSSCEKEVFIEEELPSRLKPDVSTIEQVCCDWDAVNFEPEYLGHNVNQAYFTNSPLCNNNLCIYP